MEEFGGDNDEDAEVVSLWLDLFDSRNLNVDDFGTIDDGEEDDDDEYDLALAVVEDWDLHLGPFWGWE